MKSERVYVRSCLKGQDWDRLVSLVPWATPQHSFAFGQVLGSSFGYLQPVYRLFFSRESIVAGLPLVRFSAGWPFHAIYSLVFDMYGGPLVHPEYLSDSELLSKLSTEIDSVAMKHGAFEARFTVPPNAPDAVNRCLQLFTHTENFRRDCPFLDLERPLSEIRKGYKASVRRAIRRSIKEGVIVEENADIEQVCKAYPIYRKRMSHIGATAKPWRFIEGLLNEKLAVSFVAQRNGLPIGLLILLVSPRMAVYWLSGMEVSASAFRPMNALLEAAICWSHNCGISMFNMGESHGGRPGLVRFKDGWGPELAQNTVTIRTYRPRIQWIWRMMEPIARRTYAIWDRCKESI